MKQYSLFHAAVVLVVALVRYVVPNDAAGFEYPNGTMPGPIDAQTALYVNLVPYVAQFETPIAIRLASSIDSVMWNCVAVYDLVALDAFTRQAPLVRVPDSVISEYGTAETRVLCGYFAAAIVIEDIIPDGLAAFQAQMGAFGLDASLTSVDATVSACGVTDSACLETAANSQGYIPEVMGSIVAHLALGALQDDGWNAEGGLGADGAVCTANCNPYSDYTGYAPKLGDLDYWQPLTEYNGKGFSYRYNHVTPHIGPMATLKYSSRAQMDARSAPDPAYDYDAEAQRVVERLAEVATDDRQKMLVEFFDDKLGVGVSILLALDIRLGWTYEQRVLFAVGYTAAEYESVIAAWNEKRRWDLPRPTTLIKNGIVGDTIETWGGPHAGLRTIASQDFESYIRVMPHSEYPSASGCICHSAQEYVDALLRNDYGVTDSVSVSVPFPFTAFPAGSSRVEPETTPATDIFASFANLTELRDTCSESRLWGGMHFTQSIEGAYQLCQGLGERAYRFAHGLRTGDVEELNLLAESNLTSVVTTTESEEEESAGNCNLNGKSFFALFSILFLFYMPS